LLLVLLAVLVGGCGLLYGHPPAGEAFPTGPVVVLGGGTGDRVELGIELVTSSTERRELVLSADAAEDAEEAGHGCEARGVRCVVPEPEGTFMEASMITTLAREEGWETVTVVTSEYHVTRTRLLFGYCMDVPTRVVASTSGLSVPTRGRLMLRESLATLASLPSYWHCP
jgi:uncharacterized SAM-binding protein YcdF (DUF218 family)